MVTRAMQRTDCLITGTPSEERQEGEMHGAEVSCKRPSLLTKLQSGLVSGMTRARDLSVISTLFLSSSCLLFLLSFTLSVLLSPRSLGPRLRQLQAHNPLDQRRKSWSLTASVRKSPREELDWLALVMCPCLSQSPLSGSWGTVIGSARVT